MNRKWSISALAIVLVVLSTVVTFGQTKQSAPEPDVVFQTPILPKHPAPGDHLAFVVSEMSFDGKLVKGAPYSAQAVTEHTQVLADGNRINRKTSAMIYRDSEGRTRREEKLTAIGPYATADERQTIFISDPVAGMSVVLHPERQVAMRNQSLKLERSRVPAGGGPLGAGPHTETFEMKIHPQRGKRITSAELGTFKVESLPQGGGQWTFLKKKESDNTVSESLGRQFFEGVEAEGTRTTVTIPAGEIGNERPIEIIDERWYSAELQTVVMSRQIDPLAGETVYKLTNINRSEPDRSLFDVPAEYKVYSRDAEVQKMRTKKPGIEH
jgi:hypothetical protein